MATLAQLRAQLKRLTGGKKKTKKKTAKKKTTSKKKPGSSLKTYQNKIKNSPGVKAATKRVRTYEMALKKARSEKAKKVKAAQKKYKAKK